MAKAKKIEHKYDEAVENYLKSLCIESEYKVAASNNQQQYADYESIGDMIELQRNEMNYSWRSNIFIGLALSHLTAEMAKWAALDFASRDFVDIYLEGNQPDDKSKSKAAKTLLNTLLNIKEVYHFQKRMKAREINWMFGQVYALMWWEQEVVTKKKQMPPKQTVQNDYDDEGNLVPKMVSIPQEPQEYEEVIVDRMNYEVFDARNVFTDFSYTYSTQDKPWITLRTDNKTFSYLEENAEKNQYFNLGLVKEKIYGLGKNKKQTTQPETETSKETYNKLGGAYGTKQDMPRKVDPNIDILDRYGKIWAVVTERDDEDNPKTIEPGYDGNGEIKEKAELVEAIITHAGIGGNYILIGFRPTWAIDSYGKPFKPILRGWCYIHPTKDIGLSDGKNLREMNIALNDTFNLNNDRTMLATLPMFKGRRDALENNPTIFIEPENIMMMENPEKDIMELTVRDNISGGMQQMAVIKSTASEMDGIWPPNLGGVPDKTSTTATATSAAGQGSNERENLKGLTWTYTFDAEFYNMILQLTYRNMRPETLQKILGKELFQFFDPKSKYTYVPLSQNLENEHQKNKKVQTYIQVQGMLNGLAKIIPKAIPAASAKVFSEVMQLLGSDYREIGEIVEKIANAKPEEEGKAGDVVANPKEEPTQNQHGLPQSDAELGARGQ